MPQLLSFQGNALALRRRAVIEGDMEAGSLMAGQSVGFVTREQSTAEILEELIAQSFAVLAARRPTAASGHFMLQSCRNGRGAGATE